MTPTIVLRKDGSVWFAVGARGGPRIISAVTQSVMNVIDYGMDIQEAIDTPRIHHQWFPDEIMYEKYGMSPDTINILTGMGHVFVQRPGNIASATGIMVGDDGVRFGAIDSRSDGEAIGY
jgi:gamma-glutamyltranspeptidase/glutathione hydrolase